MEIYNLKNFYPMYFCLVGFGEENKNLWKKCQAIACFASWEGERCLYFPQGHLEQVIFCVIVVIILTHNFLKVQSRYLYYFT